MDDGMAEFVLPYSNIEKFLELSEEWINKERMAKVKALMKKFIMTIKEHLYRKQKQQEKKE